MTWLTETGRDAAPPGDRLAALWAEPGILGYRMVIWPVSALRVAARAMETFYGDLAGGGTQTAWLDRMQTRREPYELIGYHDYEALDDAIARSVLPDELPDCRVDGHGGP